MLKGQDPARRQRVRQGRQAGRNEEIPPIWGTFRGLRLNEYIRSAFRVLEDARKRKAIWRGKSKSIRTEKWRKDDRERKRGAKRRGTRHWPIVLCLKPRAILMRRTCYMEWNKEGWMAEGWGGKYTGKRAGIVARKRRAASRGILRRVTHVRRICVHGRRAGEGDPRLTAPLHFNSISPHKISPSTRKRKGEEQRKGRRKGAMLND